jgi:anti-sigma-K factor RskA
MNEHDHMTTPGDRDCSGDAAAYALGALEPNEAAAFRLHLETCVVCRDELAEFERVVDVLPMAVPQYEAPASLRHTVLKGARAELAATEPAASGAAPRPWHAAWWRRGLPRPRLALATAALAALAVVAVVLATSGSSGSRVITAAVTGPGRAEVKVSGGRAELVIRGFPAPPPGDVYEVWLQHGTAAPSPTTTLFSVTREGRADVGVAGRLTGVSRVMVTPEPAGGSRVPTHAPIIVARLD